jgi:hypothetical protein
VVCRPKYVEQLRNIGIINSTTQLHLVGSFCEIYHFTSPPKHTQTPQLWVFLLKEGKPKTGPKVIEKAIVTENAQCFIMK